MVRAGLVATSIVAVLAIRPGLVQPLERGGALMAPPIRASSGRAAAAASIPVHALILSDQARRYPELPYRSYPTGFMGCMIGTIEPGAVPVSRIAPADGSPSRAMRPR